MSVPGRVRRPALRNSAQPRPLPFLLPGHRYWAGTYTGNFTLTGDADGLLPNKDNCTLDNGFGWDDLYGNRTPAERLYVDEVGFDIGIGPYSPFSTFSDGQGLQMYDFVKREVYEANYEAWTTDRTYPRQYFFNDHPNAGARSFDYVYSLIGVVTGAFYACMLVCLVPMQLKQLMCGSDEDGDGGGMNIAGINLGNV